MSLKRLMLAASLATLATAAHPARADERAPVDPYAAPSPPAPSAAVTQVRDETEVDVSMPPQRDFSSEPAHAPVSDGVARRLEVTLGFTGTSGLLVKDAAGHAAVVVDKLFGTPQDHVRWYVGAGAVVEWGTLVASRSDPKELGGFETVGPELRVGIHDSGRYIDDRLYLSASLHHLVKSDQLAMAPTTPLGSGSELGYRLAIGASFASFFWSHDFYQGAGLIFAMIPEHVEIGYQRIGEASGATVMGGWGI